MSERQNILNSLKISGELTAAEAANNSGLTSMGARGHLERLEQKGLVGFREEKGGRGRPKRLWFLTDKGHAQFPQQYDHLSIELISSVRELFGQDGLNQLIALREVKALAKYETALSKESSAEGKVKALAEERTHEGYMADIIATDNGWQLVEHHCPICAAAEVCQGFCESELSIFRRALGNQFEVHRQEHVLTSEGERCRYSIKKKT